MKNLITTVILLSLSFLTACTFKPAVKSEAFLATNEINKITFMPTPDTFIGYQKLSQLLGPDDWGGSGLEDFSADLIVIGEFCEETDIIVRYEYNNILGKDVWTDGTAVGKLRITRVLKGDKKKGDIITIGQHYFFDEENNDLITYSELTPMHKGDRWIYFLRGWGDHYSAAGDYDSRYPLPNKDIMKIIEAPQEHEDFDPLLFGVYNRSKINFSLYAEILEYFKIKPSNWVNPN
ncbi:MAG: hypothetical protein FWG91_13370 [Lachnospiraceae bacterium]|nr:hypothetical protein [Lachnospiraceae bacterium]